MKYKCNVVDRTTYNKKLELCSIVAQPGAVSIKHLKKVLNYVKKLSKHSLTLNEEVWKI